MRTEPTPIEEEPASPGATLAAASNVLRESGRDAVIVGVILVMIMVALVTRLAGGVELGPPRAVLLTGLGVPYAISLVLLVRSRQTLLRTLGHVRMELGAPIDPLAPWTERDEEDLPDPDTVLRETRRMLGAAYRCYDLSWGALLWALGSAAMFVLWTLATPGS